jgi:Ca-activated chloride channel family protein
MHFARPDNLYLLWLMPALGLFMAWSLRNRRRRLERLIAPALAQKLTNEFSRGKAVVRAVLMLGCFVFIILALSRPQWGMKQETVRRHGVDILVALDTSYSMNAEDVSPTRMEKAKGEIRSLVGKLKGDRIGLINFAGSAIVQCPLTLDYGAVNLFLDIAGTESIPDPGTSLASAISTANSAFIARERKYKVLIIITDGEDLEGQVESAVEKARAGGVIIYTIGVGTPDGRPIPVRDARGNVVEYRKDTSGQVVISRLDEKALAQIAASTGGRYFRATTAEGELDELYGDISQMEKKELESRLYQNFEDRFQYPLAMAILLLMIEAGLSERRKPGTTWRERILGRWRNGRINGRS